jgi:D-sedoheptulose 7-phosphate isomerase
VAEVSQVMTELVQARLAEAIIIKQQMQDTHCINDAVAAATIMIAALRNGGKVLFFGNGGSSMDAGHLAAELAGRFYRDRPGIGGVSLSDSTASLTAIANDYSYDDIFARQVRGLGRPGDVAVGLTTSGNSKNVLEGLRVAREIGLHTVALTGLTGGKAVDLVEVCIRVPSEDTPRIQEACMHLGHTICEIVEQEMFPSDEQYSHI